MAKYFLLDLFAAAPMFVPFNSVHGIWLEWGQSFVFAISVGYQAVDIGGDAFHTGIESKGCQSAVAVHYDFFHVRAHSPACYIVSHTACQKNIFENTPVVFS